MSVYVDRLCHQGFKYRGVLTQTAHLTADSEEELHEFANKLMIPKSWCHYGSRKGSRPHYDITAKYLREATLRGAQDGIAPRRPAILAADVELARLRGIAENEKGLLDIIKRQEKEIERLREAVEWACKKLDHGGISFCTQHMAAVDLERCACWECDASAFAEMIRRRAEGKEKT